MNTGLGSGALAQNIGGVDNTAVGASALVFNTSGSGNTAVGADALNSNSTGSANVAVGSFALGDLDGGSGNIALGNRAGDNPTTAGDSIFIGNRGSTGTDSDVIRIGNVQTSTFIAGIRGVTTGQNNGINVLIDSNGQLGTVSSSRRYKENIRPMGAMRDMLARLRPVSFRYVKPYADGSKPLEYGLIAEEVAEVFPTLAVFNEKGQPETVRYHLLSTFLLEGFQEQQRVIAAQAEELSELRRTTAAMEERLQHLELLLSRTSVTTASN